MKEEERGHGMPKPEDYDTIYQQRRVDATFNLYHPETDAEVWHCWMNSAMC